jgi:heavy metal sensor kinase
LSSERSTLRWSALRVRLTISYVLLLSLILLGIGFLFHETLDYTLFANTEQILNEEWAAVKGYLRLENRRPVWFFDPQDSEEAFIVRRLRRVFLLTDSEGRILEVSPVYSHLGVESPEEIRQVLAARQPLWRVRVSDQKIGYLVRSGVHYDEARRPYFLAVGRALDTNERILRQFTVRYMTAVPVLVLLISAAGWIAAGRALRPLNDVARVAQSITGDRLDLRIPPRGAGDELDHLIGAFNSMVDRLEGSFKQVRQFSTDVSHELRTPLTAIRGQLEVALFTAKNQEQYRDAIIDAIADVEQLAKVVRALLHLSQAESGQLHLAFEPVSLATLVREMAEQLEVMAESKSVMLTTEMDDRVVVSGDRLQLERLLTNLIGNAIKYTPGGGRVRVEVFSRGRQAILAVEDTGCGIAPDHLPHIFDRLYRAPDGKPDAERGLGLGLSFVAWIAKVHNGRIDVRSKPGEGSRFEVRLPLAEASAPAAQGKEQARTRALPR